MPVLVIDAPAAQVVVIQEARRAMSVQAASGLKIQVRGDVTSVTGPNATGWLERAAPWLTGGGCTETGVRRWWTEIPMKDLPKITVRLPLDSEIVATGAVFGQVGPGRGLTLTAAGCGTWRLAPLSTGLTVTQGGAGRVVADQVDGQLTATLDGPGEILVKAGTTTTANLSLKGSGRIEDRGTVGMLDAKMGGSGHIVVRTVMGRAKAAYDGDGDVRWGRPRGKKFCSGMNCF